MNKLLLLILLFNTVKASHYICKCENMECDNIKINECVKWSSHAVVVFDGVLYSADLFIHYNYRHSPHSLNQYEKYANICNKRDQNYNCVKYYGRETDLPDKRNHNIYMYIYIVYEHELANTNKFIVEKNRIRLVIKDYDIYKLFEVRGRDVYDEIKMLGFNANTEIEYSDIFDFGNIKFPIDNCGIYLSLAIKYPHENIRAFYDFHDGYEYIIFIGERRVLQTYGYSIKYTCYTRKYQNVDNNKITHKLQDENQQLQEENQQLKEENQQVKDDIQNLKNRIKNVANFISI